MEQIRGAIRQLIEATDEELDIFLAGGFTKTFKRKEVLSHPNVVPNEIFFIVQGIIRVVITDAGGTDHTLHFALENEFIADYACFINEQTSLYRLEAIEPTTVLVLPRNSIMLGYKMLNQGQKLGRLIAEYYFIYQDNRIKDLYTKTPKERYDHITTVFPNIHNRAPQHMIASYLGISPVHLSRLKQADLAKT